MTVDQGPMPQRRRWTVFLLPLAVFMLCGSLEPTPALPGGHTIGLAIPYANLAAMKREMGDNAAATRLQELAEKAKGTTVR